MSILSKNFDITVRDYSKARPTSFKLQIKKVSLTKVLSEKLMAFRPVSRQTNPIDLFLTELAIATSLRPEMRVNWIEVANQVLVQTVAIPLKMEALTAKSRQPVIKAATQKKYYKLAEY